MKLAALPLLALCTVAAPLTALPATVFTGKELARVAALYERARQEGRFRNEREERDVNYFMGYAEGAALSSRKICLPSTRGVREQVADTTAKYLRQHPRELNQAPDVLVVKALQPAFPCPKPKR